MSKQCDFCGGKANLHVNGLWTCHAHLEETVALAMRLEAFHKDAPMDVANNSIEWALDFIRTHPEEFYEDS